MGKWIVGLSMLIAIPFSVTGQTSSYPQFWNRISFSRPAFKKSGLEFNFGQTWTGNPENKSMFADNSQLYLRGWFHYFYSSRWRFSTFLAYHSNKDVPELNQTRAPEIRSGVQSTYFFKKIPYTLDGRLRLENRNIQNNEGNYETSFRLRMQLRCLYPLNARIIHQGTVYALGSEELMFKTSGGVSGSQFFDRNRLTIGGGYAVTNDIQMELSYVNDFLPREPVNKLINALQFNIYFINPFIQLKEAFFKPHPVESDPEND